MIRRVAFKKAIFGGFVGAIAWELAARLMSAAGLRIFDLVYVLGSMIFEPPAPVWKWWTTGLVTHCLVGATWAIFYAYFFWSTFDCRPILQGTIFSLLPAALAGAIMVPQLNLMHPDLLPRLGPFAVGIGIGGPVMIVAGHLIYGAVLGRIYVRPVGYPAGKRISLNA